jgi:CBS domain-containing protein
MRVKDVMTAVPSSVWITDSLATAAKTMWENDCGILPIIKDNKVVGVVTDRDVCMASAMRERPQSAISVEEVMGREVFSVMPDDDVQKALGLMQEHKIRRLPVLNVKGELEGILSMNDLVLRAEDANSKKKPQLSFQDVFKTYKAICEHPVPMTTAATSSD